MWRIPKRSSEIPVALCGSSAEKKEKRSGLLVAPGQKRGTREQADSSRTVAPGHEQQTLPPLPPPIPPRINGGDPRGNRPTHSPAARLWSREPKASPLQKPYAKTSRHF
ncbi:hypothetical protein NPIL_526101 [Nephila pilipes]|uniref:Uncharacterized protein n=1 Tax=Nephila pilipes TaxID=299642 RepID=A0A8X6U8M5_NEPPI|nr:hypothetical protein NPIL_526101 [Nephila pilipes]